MKRQNLVLVVASAALFVAACGPSINAAHKADIDRRLAALGPPTQNFGGPDGFVPKPLAVGQWATYKAVDDGKPSFVTYKITGQQGAAFWFETETEAYTGKNHAAILLDPGDRKTPESIVIVAMKTKDDKGQVSEMPESMLGFMRSMVKDNLQMLSVTWEGLPQEAASVPAGTFANCYKTQTTAAWGPFKSSSLVWSHSDVPISGMVRSQSLNDPHTMELVSFGDSGARTSF